MPRHIIDLPSARGRARPARRRSSRAERESALQGEVAPSTNTSITTPFGVLGEFNPSGSTFGVGTIGISTTGYALAGESLSNSQPSILAYPGGNGIGLEATTQSTSSSPAILATSKGMGDGIDATLTQSGGRGAGLIGGAGVFGNDLATPPPSNTTVDESNAGVVGETSYGYAGVYGYTYGAESVGAGAIANRGVAGYSLGGVGVSGDSASGTLPAIEASGENGGDGVDSISEGAEAFNGTAGNASALALYNKSASSAYPTIQSYQAGTGDMIAAGSPNGSFVVDQEGNIIISGSVSGSAASRQLTQNPNTDMMSYGDEMTQPTMEDVGSAHLLNGSAMVPLAADYRQTIDGSNYMVFLTPNGQSHGLYVASKTPTGFVVRENDGGRSTLAFDYRIVAQQFGAHEGRLPHFASVHPDITKQSLANFRNNSLKIYDASRLKLAAQIKHDTRMRAAFKRRFTPQPLPANPLGVSFSKR